MPDGVYVFGYASLVQLNESGAISGHLRGFRRSWGVAMNNWEGGEGAKHWLDRATGERPRIRVAYLDIYKDAECAVNGLALPVDAERLAALDEREVNYRRVDVTTAFEGDVAGQVFTYIGLDAARKRCHRGSEEGNAFVAADYVTTVRRAFADLASDALTELDRTTDPCPFPERDLRVVHGDIDGLSPL